MRIDTQTIRPVAALDAATGAMPQAALPQAALPQTALPQTALPQAALPDTPVMRWAAIAATFVTMAAVLLACGLAVVMNLS
jgi:hypothetical protein